MSTSRKICVVTGSRAEYSHLYGILKLIDHAPDLELQLVVTGMHLSPEFGYTFRDIERDGFRIDKKVEMTMSSDTGIGVAKSIGVGVLGLADAFEDLAPDVVLLLGDRSEMMSAGIAALALGVPIAHVHGGEVTHGAIDDALRHSLTKFADLHFVATETYGRRVQQLGEDKEKIFNCGAPCIDVINDTTKSDRARLERVLGIGLNRDALLIAFHPETAGPVDPIVDVQELLAALGELENVNLVFTRTNSDKAGRAINRSIENFVSTKPESACVLSSLGRSEFYSLLFYVKGIVGNSSSGIIEAPSYGIGTLNVGARQSGRVRAKSVIDCSANAEELGHALSKLLSDSFQRGLKDVENPYGAPGASSKIVDILRTHPLRRLEGKKFVDILN